MRVEVINVDNFSVEFKEFIQLFHSRMHFKVFRIDDLTTQFRKGLKELMAKEKENGDYDVIWGAK